MNDELEIVAIYCILWQRLDRALGLGLILECHLLSLGPTGPVLGLDAFSLCSLFFMLIELVL